MTISTRTFRVCGAAAAMLALILDSRTALAGAGQGLTLCIKTVIPSLFPFFVLSDVMIRHLGSPGGRAGPLARFCCLPSGCRGLWIPAFLGGYPVGARSVTQRYLQGALTRSQARRLLGFCSNCGPAFLFGITGPLFSRGFAPWILWLIHILSALAVARLLPQEDQFSQEPPSSQETLKGSAVDNAVRVMGGVCGWIILFRCLLAFLDRWFLWFLPKPAQTVVWGCLELTNGCIALSDISQESLRFILASGFLGFGGLCVLLQTHTVTSPLGLGLYLPGKLLQAGVSVLFSLGICPFLYPEAGLSKAFVIPAALITGLLFRKKAVAFSSKPLYNGINATQRSGGHAVSQKDRQSLRLLRSWHGAWRRSDPVHQKRHHA